MTKKPRDLTKTTEFEIEGHEEAYAPSRPAATTKPWKGLETPKLQVETPPELQEPTEHTAKIWILERRARGILATVRRWFVGKSRR